MPFWTEEAEKKLVELYQANLANSEIATRLGRSVDAINQRAYRIKLSKLNIQNARFRILSEVEKAWLAAAIDGEGTIYYGMHKSSKRIPFKLYTFVEIANTNREFLENAVRICGGGRIKLMKHVVPRPNRKPCYGFWLARGGTEIILPQVLPYLIIKREKAIACLRFLKEHPGISHGGK